MQFYASGLLLNWKEATYIWTLCLQITFIVESLGTDWYAHQSMALTEIKPFVWTFFLFAYVMVEVALLNNQREKNTAF